MKNLQISVGANKATCKIKKADIPDIAESLSKTELEILVKVFIDHSKVKGISKRTIDSLCSKGIIRHDVDLLTNKPIIVLNPGGKMLCDFIKRGGKEKQTSHEEPTKVRVEIERHYFQSQSGSLECSVCQKPFGHKIHIAEGVNLCAGMSHDVL